MSYRHAISAQSWAWIKELLEPENKGESRPSKPNHHMLNGILWIAKTGAPG